MQCKRILAAMLAAVMTAGTFVSALPVAVSAAETEPAKRESNLVQGYTDPWTTDELPELSAPADQNVDQAKFTHNEYTGLTVNGIHNEDVFGVNREEASVFSTTGIVYDSVEKALAGAQEYDLEGSGYYQKLTGEDQADWSLTVVKNAAEADSAAYRDFYKPGYETFAESQAQNKTHNYGIWKTGLALPASWEYYGFDYSIYTNDTVPWQSEDDRSTESCPEAPVNFNPVGLYRKTFTVNDSLKKSGGRIYLNLQGVESAYYVYVNGKEVGYSEDSFDPHSFDVTDYLVDGENLLAVKVHRFSDGTWFELQDMYQDGGIFRDIYLYTAPLVHIDDYFITTDLDENYVNATMNLDLTVRNSANTPAEGYKVDVRLYDEDGNMFFNGMTLDIPAIPAAQAKTGNEDIIEHTNVGEVSGSAVVYAPELWTAETPNLYYLVLSLYSADGEYMGSMAQQHGFREIEFTRTEVDENGNAITPTEDYQQVKINGQRLLIKGANRHETDPVYGKYVHHEVMEQDVAIMKQNNINAVSTAHYTNDDYFYWLCNKYGLYVNAEPNIECHQLQSAGAGHKIALCKEMVLDRGKAALEQLKNCTSIVIWEDNNECYWSNDKDFADGTMYELLWYFKENDPTRPVVDAGNTDSSTYGMGNGADLSNHGYSERDVMEDLATFERPWLMTEYAHSMGNATGSIYEYWEYVRANEYALGGFIWDLIDQGRRVSLSGNIAGYYSVTDRAGGKTGQVQLSDISNFYTVTDEAALTDKAIGGGSYVVFQDNAAFNKIMSGTGKSFTLEVICKPATLGSNQILIAKGDTQIAIKTNGSGQLEMFGFENDTYYTMTAPVSDNWIGSWHQVVGVYDKGTMSLYVDGQLMASKSFAGTGLAAGDALFALGYQTDERNGFDGDIALGRVYTRALTAEEIQAQNSKNPAITADSDDVFLWVDLADMDENSAGSVVYTDFDYYGEDYAKETLYDNAGYFYAYGGDNGEVNHSGNFCQNGLCLPDRTVQPEMYEVKYTYQDYWFTADEADLKQGIVSVFNETSFTDLSKHTVKWSLLEDGKVIAEGKLADAAVAPGETAELAVPYLSYLPETLKAGAEYFLNLSVYTAEGTDMVPLGHEIAYAQFELPESVEKVEHSITSQGVTIDDSGDSIAVSGDNFRFTVNGDTGIIENYYYNDELLLEQGPVPNYWRALMDNDKRYDGAWQYATQDLSASDIVVGKNEEGKSKIDITFSFPNMPGLEQTMSYLIEDNGAITISTTVDATALSGNRFLRIGTNLILPEGFENINWYGGGPVEALYDREKFSRVGLYETTVNDLFFPYMAANDTGTLTNISWFTVTGEESSYALAMAAYEPLECSALHFALEDLSAADHPYELEPQAETYLAINYRSQGTGNAACGPDVWEEYVLPTSEVYSYSYTLVPYEKGADVMELTRSYRKVPSTELTKLMAEALAKSIDSLNVTNAGQLAEAQELMAQYEALSDYGKSVVGENRYTKLTESVTLAQKLTDGAITVGVRDQSVNGFDLDVSGNPDISIVDNAFRGKAALSSDEQLKVFGNIMNGTKAFTIEAVAKANGTTNIHNLITSKGDECVALRFSANHVDFFICNEGGDWVNARATLSEEQLNRYVHIVGVYDGSSIYLYLDGNLAAKQDNAGAVKASNYPLTLGYDPMFPTERVGNCLIRSLHVYSKALSAEKIANGTLTAADESVALWYDFAGSLAFMENGEAIDATDIRTEVTQVKMVLGETYTVDAEPMPYYASVLGWAVADDSVATVDNGVLTAVGLGETTLTITAEGSGVRVEIPVTVTLPEGAVELLISRIEGIEGHKTGMTQLQEMMNLYNALDPVQQAAVGQYRIEKLNEAIELKEKMDAGIITNAADVVEDKSANGFDLVLADQPDMTLADGAITGWGDVKGENADEFFHEMFSGNNPFTVDVVMNPNGNGSGPNMIFSKGDETTAMRIYGGSVNFYIFEGNDTWKMITAPLSASQLNSWIRITGVYTGSEIQIYVNGTLASSAEAGALVPSDYPLGIGYCPMYPADSSDPYLSWASFRNVHVYSRALTKQEIYDQSVTTADPNAVLWYDVDDTSNTYFENGEIILPTGIRTGASELRLLKGEKKDIYADVIPYYVGDVNFAVEDSSVAYVSPDGTVTGKKEGTTTIILTVEGTDIRTEIPVSVQTTDGAAVSIAQEAKALAEQANALAAEAAAKAEEAQAAADAAADVSAEDTQAAQKAAAAAEAAAAQAEAAQAAAQAAQTAAENAAAAAEEYDEAAAASALDAAKAALKAAEDAGAATASAVASAQAQAKAQAAQAKAEEAQAAADAAAKDAEDAADAADAAQAEVAEDKQAAEKAANSAGEAKTAAEAAQAQADAAKAAAEAAAKAADESNSAAANSAAQAAEDAALAADTAKQAAGYASAAAQAQLAAQKAQAEAEAAAKAAEEARKKAEEEAAARKAAAELATAKETELIKLMLLTDSVDTAALSPNQRDEYNALVEQALAAVEDAEDIAFVTGIADELGREVEALLDAPNALRFEDVKEEDWFFGSVDYVAVKGLMIGTTDTTFGPNESLTRAQFATILYRIAGQPEADTELSFTDVPDGQWYSDAVLWAAENGIVLGNGDGTFGTEENITREQMILMMFRYAKHLNMDTENDGTLDSFADAASVSDYAIEAMSWAVDNGIITGKAGGTEIDPQGSTTRAECAAIIQRFFGIS